MKAEELRIGNWVREITHSYNRVVQIDRNHFFQLEDELEIDVFPIPLTEEWLLKFGFSVPEYYPLAWGKGRLRVNVGNQKTWLYGDEPIIDIKHVHQLQNIYFALTGDELISKLDEI